MKKISLEEILRKELRKTTWQRDALLAALQRIIDECPNPKLPYGIAVVEIAKQAIADAKKGIKIASGAKNVST